MVYPDMRDLYRVYNGGWTLGGRLYGGFWQQVPSDERQHFVLDGERTVEVDFKTLHPRLLYAAAGKTLKGDAYAVPGVERQIAKRAWNILLNAYSRADARGAIALHCDANLKVCWDGVARSVPTAKGLREADRVMAAVKARHPAIASWFHSGSGLRLQHMDSEMCRAVLDDLMLRKGIPVLPVHDSFIVRERDRDTLVRAMERAFWTAAERAPGAMSVAAGKKAGSGTSRGVSFQMEGAGRGVPPSLASCGLGAAGSTVRTVLPSLVLPVVTSPSLVSATSEPEVHLESEDDPSLVDQEAFLLSLEVGGGDAFDVAECL